MKEIKLLSGLQSLLGPFGKPVTNSFLTKKKGLDISNAFKLVTKRTFYPPTDYLLILLLIDDFLLKKAL